MAMNIFQLNQQLNQIAELQWAFSPDDALTEIVRQYGEEDELDPDALEWVSAAGAGPDYRSFLKLAQEREHRG